MIVLTVHLNGSRNRYWVKEHDEDVAPENYSIRTIYDSYNEDNRDRVRLDKLIPKDRNELHEPR